MFITNFHEQTICFSTNFLELSLTKYPMHISKLIDNKLIYNNEELLTAGLLRQQRKLIQINNNNKIYL